MFVVEDAPGEAVVQAAEHAVEKVALGGGVAFLACSAAVVVGAGAATLIHQHMTSERDRVIADRMGEAVRKALGKEESLEPSGTPVARPE